MRLDIQNNNPNIKFVVEESCKEDFKEEDAVICLGMYCSKFGRPIWKTIRFTTKDLKCNTFADECIEIVSAMLIQSANHHGWATWD